MKEFLESTPLYQRVFLENGEYYQRSFSNLPAIAVYCSDCGGVHTFNPTHVNERRSHEYSIFTGAVDDGSVHRIIYICKMCNRFEREYLVRIFYDDATDDNGETVDATYLQKVGQFPAHTINPEPTMKDYLDKDNLVLYKRGIMCESQSYGVGAFAYYRQVVENKINNLIADIEKFIENEDKQVKDAFTEAKKNQDTAKKIDLVSNYLPNVLKPDNNNVLRIIYTALSDGLHNKSDEECLEVAQSLRACLVFLVKKIEEQRRDVQTFKASVKNLQKKTQSSKSSK